MERVWDAIDKTTPDLSAEAFYNHEMRQYEVKVWYRHALAGVGVVPAVYEPVFGIDADDMGQIYTMAEKIISGLRLTGVC